MTWRHGIPPKSGWYQVKWDPDDATSERVYIERSDLAFGAGSIAAYSDGTTGDDEPYPGEDTPYAMWLDNSPLVGSREPRPAMTGRCH